MTCSYCGSRNGEEEHRCRKCGRRPGDILSEGSMHGTDGALATKLRPVQPATDASILAEQRARNLSRAVQGTLFQDRSSNIIPFEQYAPQHAEPRRPPAPRASNGRNARRSRISEEQGMLDFLPPAPQEARLLGSTAEAFIYCDAPVASTLHRAVAAAMDWSMVLVAYGLFLLVYFKLGGAFAWDKTTLMVFGGMLVLIAMTYATMWAVAGTESAGMRWARLRLTTFDGFPPEARQRWFRLAASCLSMCTVLGLAWSLVDEECLTWHDHISRTFPTPREAETQILQRG